MNNQQHICDMSDTDLRISAFGEGVPPERDSVSETGIGSLTVYMDEEKTDMPFGMIENEPFLELFWRKTGADCDGEKEAIELPDGKTYMITLRETR